MRKKPLSSQVVVVAGGSYGLGRAVAVSVARRGADVVVGARGEDGLAGTVREVLGKQPQPVPPIYQPEPFAEAVARMCERPARELPVGWGAQKLLWGQKLSPRAADLILLRNGWRGQHTAWTWLRLRRAPLGAGLALATVGLLAGLSGRFSPR